MQTGNIELYLKTAYSDESLAALIAHVEDGKLAFYCCCCFIGIPTADHPLKTGSDPFPDGTHYDKAVILPYAKQAESEFYQLSYWRDERLERLLPLLYAERDRRAQSTTNHLDVAEAIEVA